MVRFRFDEGKSEALRRHPKRGIGFDEVQELFARPYYLDQRSDLPEQYRAIGWVRGELFSVIFEVREDAEGDYHHLVTLWKATKEDKRGSMKKAPEENRPLSADEVADKADRGEDISRFFTNRGRMVKPVRRVNVDFRADMLLELDELATQLNVSRQAAIKTLVRQGLDQRYLAERGRRQVS